MRSDGIDPYRVDVLPSFLIQRFEKAWIEISLRELLEYSAAPLALYDDCFATMFTLPDRESRHSSASPKRERSSRTSRTRRRPSSSRVTSTRARVQP